MPDFRSIYFLMKAMVSLISLKLNFSGNQVVFFLILLLIPLLVVQQSALAGERFTDNGNGTITDHQLGLMWASTDNQGNITWKQADKWVRFTFPYSLPIQYQNWRLPTLQELQSLYVKDPDYRGYEADCGQQLHIVPRIHMSCGFVWSGDQEGISAYVFNFGRGTFYTDRKVHNKGYRALAVRNIAEK